MTYQEVITKLTARNRRTRWDKFPVTKNRPSLLASPLGREAAFTAPPSERTGKWLEKAVEKQALQNSPKETDKQ